MSDEPKQGEVRLVACKCWRSTGGARVVEPIGAWESGITEEELTLVLADAPGFKELPRGQAIIAKLRSAFGGNR